MSISNSNTERLIKIRGTEIFATDTLNQYREKIGRIALDEMYQFVTVLDPDGTLVEVNRAALTGVGLKLSDVKGKPFWQCFWWLVSKETQHILESAISLVKHGEFVRYDVEIFGKANGNDTIIIDFSMVPVKDEFGKVVLIIAEGRDITEKKALERQVAKKTADLQALLQHIQKLDEFKTQFFVNISHELRTPLALILGSAERLLDGGASVGPSLQLDAAQVIVRNAKMLLKNVNDLLDISKLEAGRFQIDLQHVDVAELIRFVASHFSVLANERHVDFRIETEEPCVLAVDQEKLQRIVMNLLSNAFKFVPNGGFVVCRLNMLGEILELSVEDSGPGIKPELRRVIFERFRQGDAGANRQFAGTGLGLAIVHQFVGLHNGTIEVLDSGLGGAKFLIKIPIIHLQATDGAVGQLEPGIDQDMIDGLVEALRLPAHQNALADLGEKEPLTKKTVLVVEDNPEMNRFIAQSLLPEYEVVCAFDGAEGLQKALLFTPVLIVSDIVMPKVSGIEMIAELRERTEMREVPILLLSAKADEELKLQLLEKSAQDFITKPFNEKELLVRVRNLINVRQSNELLRDAETTKRKAVEATNDELRSHSKYLSELFEQTPSFMAVVRGPNHIFELANMAYYKLVGQRDLIGKPVIEVFPEVIDQGFVDILDQVLSTGKPFSGSEVPMVLESKTTGIPNQRYMDFIYQPLTDNVGAIGIFVEGHDVTEQVIAKKQLKQNEERLEQQVQERTRDLKKLNESLKLSNESLQQFAHVASHDMKEPIRKIKFFGNLLQDGYQQCLPEKANIYLNKILSATERIYSMVNGVLLYSTVAAGDELTEMVDLNEILKHIGMDLEIPIREKKVTFLIEELPKLVGVPFLLYQLFYNLVNNSIKFAKVNEPPIINIKYTRVAMGGHAFFKIVLADNGIGFKQEYAERIFATFTRLNSKDNYEGTGLGLALCKKIVQRHHGFISANGEENKGAEITMLFPFN